MYSRRKFWKNVLSVLFIMFILTNGVVWVHQHAYATGVSPQATSVYGQAGSFTTTTSGTTSTTLNGSRKVVEDSSGDLYVSDYFNNRVLYYASGSTTATRVYGQAGSFTTGTLNNGGISATSLNGPTGLALDSSGNLYITDTGNRVLYYPAGSTTATRVYGQNGSFTTALVNNTGGTANTVSATSLYDPRGLALDSSGNLYIADYGNNRVLYYLSGSTTATRVYGQAGSFTTVTPNNGGISATSLLTPIGVALDSSGNLYVADYANHRVTYYLSGSTTATRVYGQGGSFTTNTSNNGGISATSLYNPADVALDSSGNLYVADSGNNRVLYYASGSTTATRVYGQAGSFTANTANNGGSSATSLNFPYGITIDSSGNLYVADLNNNRVLLFQTSLSVTTQPPASPAAHATFSTAATLIDVGSGATFTDFTGTVSAAIKSGTGTSGAALSGTTSVSAVSGVATFSNLSINLSGTGYILTLSSPGMGSANTSTFTITSVLSPQAVTVYGQGGSFTSSSTNNGGISATSLNHPRSVVFDSSGNLYVAELNNNRVLYYPTGSTTATRVYGQFGSFSTNVSNNNGGGVSGSPNANNLNGPSGLALDSSGNLYVADDTNNRMLYYASGSTTATRVYGQAGSFSSNTANNGGVSADSLNNPNHIALDSSNNLYVADYFNSRVLYYAAGSTTATRVYGQAGSFSTSSSNKGGISANSLNNPNSVNPDSSGNLYVADHGNNRVLYYPSSSTTATSVYGQNSIFTSNLNNNTSGTANTISATSLSNPKGLDIDNGGNLYVADYNNNRVLYYAAGSTTATRVYGQGGSFSVGGTNTGGTSATSLNQPFGLTIDNGGNLYVADNNNNRVLLFQTSLSVTTQPPASPAAQATFSTAATLIDVGSGATFSDFTGTVSVAIRTGTGASGAVLSGTTSVTASSGVATFSNLSINLSSAGYMLALSSPGVGSGTTNAFIIGSSAPTGYWKLDDGSGTTASDSSGNSNPGTITGATWTTGKVNGALSFSGTTNYVSMGTPAALEFGTGSFTVMSWFKTTQTSQGRIVTNGVSSYSAGFSLAVNMSSCSTGCVGMEVGGGSVGNTIGFNTTATGFNDGNWHQTAMVIDQTAKTGQLYVDGVAQALTPVSSTCGTGTGTTVNIAAVACASASATSTDPFILGEYRSSGGTTSAPLAGSIDEVRTYNSALSSSQIQSQYTADTTPTLSGYWPFDEGSGTTTADLSGNNNTGTITGASWTTGRVNGALSFNGTTNYVSMGTPAALKLGTGSFTVMNWFKTTATVFGRMVSTGVSGYSNGFDFGVNTTNACSAGCVGAELGGGSQAKTISFGTTATTFNNGNWHQAAMVIDQSANTAQLYVDGVAQSLATQSGTCGTASGTSVNIAACTSASATNSTDPFTLGAYHSSGGTTSMPFAGSLDEVRVYGSALTGAQILNQYAIDTMPSPAGYWPLDEDSGTTAYDSSSNANNGSLAGTNVVWAPGKINSGLSFSAKYVIMGTPSTLEFNNTSFSLVSWFNSTQTAHSRFVSSGLYNAAAGFEFGLNTISAGGVGGGLGANGTAANTVQFGTTTTFNDGNWHQAVMVVDQTAKTGQLYVDGVAQPLTKQNCGTVSGTTDNFSACSLANTYSTTEPFTLGAYKSGVIVNQPFIGSLDEVRVYGSALSSPQVQNLYANDTNALSEYASNASFSATIGTTATYTLPIALTYQLTPAPGWSLSITSTTLTSGANTLPTTASSITSVTGTCNTNWTCTSNTLLNTISGLPMALPAGTTAPTAAKFFSTAVGTGTGAYTVTPTFSVTVPATAKTGTYTSTITLTAAIGP